MKNSAITWLPKDTCETMFGSYPPEFTQFPSAVFKSTRTMCALITDAMESVPSPWPQLPLFNAEGRLELDAKVEFKDWLKPFAKEEFSRKWCEGRAQASNDVVLVDAEAVEERVEIALRDLMSEPFPLRLRKIKQVLDVLDWVGQALDPDADFVAFFFNPRIQHRRESLVSRATSQSIDVWQISVGNDGLLLLPSSP